MKLVLAIGVVIEVRSNTKYALRSIDEKLLPLVRFIAYEAVESVLLGVGFGVGPVVHILNATGNAEIEVFHGFWGGMPGPGRFF